MEVTIEMNHPEFAVARGCALLCANRFFENSANPLLQRLKFLGNLQTCDIFTVGVKALSSDGKN